MDAKGYPYPSMSEGIFIFVTTFMIVINFFIFSTGYEPRFYEYQQCDYSMLGLSFKFNGINGKKFKFTGKIVLPIYR
jgi:hypothetical protein